MVGRDSTDAIKNAKRIEDSYKLTLGEKYGFDY